MELTQLVHFTLYKVGRMALQRQQIHLRMYCMHIYRTQAKLREGSVFTGVCLSTGCLSRGGGYVRGWVVPPPRYMGPGILRDTVEKRVVRILLECFLVMRVFSRETAWYRRVTGTLMFN